MKLHCFLVSLLCFDVACAIPWPGLLFYPLDKKVGNVKEVTEDGLSERLRGKNALVVGGTDGIGRGTALVLAKEGASVMVAGHSPMKAAWTVGNMTSGAKYPQEQKFGSFVGDLLTVQGCLNFTEQVKVNGLHFDYVVFTVGMWPDPQNPKTGDGLDKVIALDVVARWLLTRELMPMLNNGARVMSVLGSTMRLPPVPAMDSIKAIIAGKQDKYSLNEMLGTAGVANDAWLQGMAARHSGIHIIGTFPGLVSTNVASTYFPTWLYPIIGWAESLIAMSAEESGKRHVQILTSPNVDNRPVTYFNVNLEGRFTNPLAQDADFGKWLWSFLTDFVEKHSSSDRANGLQVLI